MKIPGWVYDLKYNVILVFKLIVIPIGIFGLIILGIYSTYIKHFANVPIVCYVDGKKVYEGVSAGINVSSSGANTTVSITTGFLYMLPKAYYVSNDVKLTGIK